MGKWAPRVEARGAYSIVHVIFDSEVKYFKNTSCKIPARALGDKTNTL